MVSKPRASESELFAKMELLLLKRETFSSQEDGVEFFP